MALSKGEAVAAQAKRIITRLCASQKKTIALVRQYAPNRKIVLGGYDTVLKDDALKPYADFIV